MSIQDGSKPSPLTLTAVTKGTSEARILRVGDFAASSVSSNDFVAVLSAVIRAPAIEPVLSSTSTTSSWLFDSTAEASTTMCLLSPNRKAKLRWTSAEATALVLTKLTPLSTVNVACALSSSP
ncbi:hypothetical protein P3C58_14245 [Mesorhizobium sp. XAP10]|uniref:hypothetical protein n=1 Tax=Mesorhizobium sp. XAP10 TaxID=3033800 RepID=UPI0023DECDD2|nr:hypothetical protein [Mesorhizobium sp. XAP10]MDF3153135.1 hypothetical protein [Mesorhizobium sp. XAP10]